MGVSAPAPIPRAGKPASTGLQRAAQIGTVAIALVVVCGAGIWGVREIGRVREEKSRERRVAIGLTWHYQNGASVLALAGGGSDEDFENIAKIKSKWPHWLRPLRPHSWWARLGREEADRMNEGLASISFLDRPKALGMALQFALYTRLMRKQTPEEQKWRKETLFALSAQARSWGRPQ